MNHPTYITPPNAVSVAQMNLAAAGVLAYSTEARKVQMKEKEQDRTRELAQQLTAKESFIKVLSSTNAAQAAGWHA